MQFTPSEVYKRVLSDDIEEVQSIDLVQVLTQQHSWNPNETIDGDTSLHLACKADRVAVVKHLISMEDFNGDPCAKNMLGQTPLELTSNIEIIKELMTKFGVNPIDILTNPIIDEESILRFLKDLNKGDLNNITTNQNTALHLACLTDRTNIVKYLLQESNIDVNAKNESDISPIQLTETTAIVRELIRYGANPTDLYHYCRRILRESRILETSVKVFVLGDSKVGKSALVTSLQMEGWFDFLFASTPPSANSSVTDTGSGVILQDFRSKYYGQTTFYDFTGGRLFHEDQSDLLRETSCSPWIFLVVVNLCGGQEEIPLNLQYWFSFLESVPSSDTKHAVIIGSHADLCRNDIRQKKESIQGFLDETVNSSSLVDYHDVITLDCRNQSSSDMTKLRRSLAKICSIARNPNTLAFNAHCFQVYIVDKFKEQPAVTFHDVLTKVKEDEEHVEETDPLYYFLPYNSFQLQKLCTELHNKSQIMYLKVADDANSSWIVVNKTELSSQLVKVFQSKSLYQISSNNGVLPFSTIFGLKPFKVYNSDMFIQFMSHLEYCKEISDKEIFQLLTKTSLERVSPERWFFFPMLVDDVVPTDVWNESDDFSYYCGWTLQCVRLEQFFSSTFLQALIVRIMFSHTYSTNAICHHLSIELKCSIWKGGISWGNRFGAEILVEVSPDNKAIVFVLRCRDANLARCMECRSQIIHQIRKCAHEFCPNVKTRESFIHPSSITTYPLSTTSSKLFDTSSLAFETANVLSAHETYISSLTGTNTISLQQLLKFEPYIELPAFIIQEICNSNNPRYITCLADHFLVRLTEQVRKLPLFVEIVAIILNDNGIMNTKVENLLSKLTEWRNKCRVTYQQLHKAVDQFSVFAGLNILDMVPGIATEDFSTPPSSPMTHSASSDAWGGVTESSSGDPVCSADLETDFNHSDLDKTELKLCDKPRLHQLTLLTKRNGKKLRIVEFVAANWKKLAVRLGFESPRMNNITQGTFYQPEEGCLRMFEKWLAGEHDLKPPTWLNLIECLEEVTEFEGLAQDLKEIIT